MTREGSAAAIRIHRLDAGTLVQQTARACEPDHVISPAVNTAGSRPAAMTRLTMSLAVTTPTATSTPSLISVTRTCVAPDSRINRLAARMLACSLAMRLSSASVIGNALRPRGSRV